jgi:hypothetical protein
MSKTTTDRRREDLEKWRSTEPYHNGWWYYQYFMDALKNKEIIGKSRR